jgi:protein-disulfide isomerase
MDLPLESIHKLAFKAAEAGQCARDQGKFWEMHDRLFANQRSLEPWSAHAEALGLDVAAFEECMSSGKHAKAIRASMAQANKVGITSTPSFAIGRTDPETSRIKILAAPRGARPFASFKAEIDKLLADEEPDKPEADEGAGSR